MLNIEYEELSNVLPIMLSGVLATSCLGQG